MTVLPRLLAACLSLSGPIALASAQSGVVNWQPTKKFTPASLAKRADEAMARSRRTQVVGQLKMTIPSGGRKGYGQSNTKTDFQDAKRFRAEFGTMSLKPGSELLKATMKADGRKTLLVVSQQPTKTAAVGQLKLYTDPNPNAWAFQHPRYFVAGLLGESPFSSLASQVAHPGSGYLSVVKERSFVKGSVKMTQYQWVVQRTAAKAKALGNLRLEFIYDGNFYLPVSMASDATLKGKARLISTNAFVWKSKRTDYDPKIFRLSKSTSKD